MKAIIAMALVAFSTTALGGFPTYNDNATAIAGAYGQGGSSNVAVDVSGGMGGMGGTGGAATGGAATGGAATGGAATGGSQTLKGGDSNAYSFLVNSGQTNTTAPCQRAWGMTVIAVGGHKAEDVDWCKWNLQGYAAMQSEDPTIRRQGRELLNVNLQIETIEAREALNKATKRARKQRGGTTESGQFGYN